MRYKLLPLPFLVLLLIGCTSPPHQTYSLLSDNPQMTLVVDLYNSLHPNDTPFVFRYTPDITTEELGKGQFDIVVGRNLIRFEPYFGNIDFLTRFLLPEYRAVTLKHQAFFDPSRMLPLSFDLPIILSLPSQSFPLFLSLEVLQEFRDTPTTTNPPFLAFTPFAHKEFFWYWSELIPVQWRRASIGDLAWNEEGLKRFLSEAALWTQEDFYRTQRAFLDKYSYLGEVNLLQRGYTNATFSRLAHWMNYTTQGEDLAYSFLVSGDQHIALQEDTTYLALSLFSSPQKPVQNFMRWLTSFEGQEAIIREVKRKSPHFYGFLNGFSFLSSVNLKVIQREYPTIAGKLPDLESLRLSEPLPFSLIPFIENIWYPWLEREIFPYETPQPLEQAIQERRYTL